MQTIEMARCLNDRGHHLWLGVPPGSRLESAARRQSLKTLPVPGTGYLHPLVAFRLSRFLRHADIQVVHCQHSRDLAVMAPAVHLAARGIVLLLSKRVGSYITKRDIFHRYTYSRVHRVLAISSVIADNVRHTTPLPPDRVELLHDAVDLTVFDPSRVTGDSVRHAFGLAAALPVIGFVGRFSPGKGHEELLRATDMLRKRGRRFHTLVVGEASHGEEAYARQIRAMAASLDLGGMVTFAGYRSDVPEVMAAFDVLAFPSHAESFGVVLIEAMAMGKPVVSTDCDGVIDIVVDGATGIMVPARNAAALADGLDRLLQDPEERSRMGTAGRRRVEEMFDQQGQISRLETIYSEGIRADVRAGRRRGGDQGTVRSARRT